MVDKEELLLRLYETSKTPHSFTGIRGLLNTAKKYDPGITRNDVLQFLQKQGSYTIHKITRKKNFATKGSITQTWHHCKLRFSRYV